MRRAGITTTSSKADTGVPLLARTGRPQQNARWMVCWGLSYGASPTLPPTTVVPLLIAVLATHNTQLPSAGKVVPVLNSSPCQESVRGTEVIVPCILNLDDRFKLQSLYLRGKNPWNPFDRRMGGYQSRSGQCIETVDPVRNRTPIPQTSSPWPVTILLLLFIKTANGF
jgi:hypothetical protein